jgi:hypothetical protein
VWLRFIRAVVFRGRVPELGAACRWCKRSVSVVCGELTSAWPPIYMRLA